MSMNMTEHDIVSGYNSLDEASCVEVWHLQWDIMEALRDHPELTREQVYEALTGVTHSFAVSWNERRYNDRDQCDGV